MTGFQRTIATLGGLSGVLALVLLGDVLANAYQDAQLKQGLWSLDGYLREIHHQ